LPELLRINDNEPWRLSASQIETYLACPYSWFAMRRLDTRSIDEVFGPAERGTFMHAVLENFYKAVQDAGLVRVTEDNVENCLDIFAKIFREQEALQEQLNPGDRYLAIDAWEERQVEEVGNRLAEYVVNEAFNLPGFKPSKLEWEYEDFEYAGAVLHGFVDRIDENDSGQAVIIDYKSSLSGDYEIKGKKEDGLEMPLRMQTLIYAQAVRKQLGKEIAGAFYVNPIKQEVRGIYDPNFVDGESFAVMKSQPKGLDAFELEHMNELLDFGEEAVAEKLQSLREGNIAPDPHSANACTYCPVVNCDSRL